MKPKSNKALLDALVDAIQDLDSYYGRTGRKDGQFRELEVTYKAARAAVTKRMKEGL